MASHGPECFDRFRNAAETTVGLVLCLIPVALWVSWSAQVFYIVLATAAGGLVVFACLVMLRPDEPAEAMGADQRPILEDCEIAEHQKLYPMIHQNTAQSRKVMSALKASNEGESRR